jgi:drug/metabolite transporter (DMT)-like permease
MSAALTALAIILAILSYSMLNIGFVLEKKAAATLPKIEEQSTWRNLRNFLTNKTWMLGFLLVNVQWFLFLFAVEFGSLSLVAPMAGVGLVVLVIFSYFYLKEPITKSEIIAIFGIISGVVILGVMSSESESSYSLIEMNNILKQIPAIVFVVIFTAIMIGMVLFSLIKQISIIGALYGLASGLASGLGVIFTKAVTSGFDTSNFWATFVDAMKQWEWWIYFALLLGFNIASTVFLQLGYQKSKAVIVSPLFSMASIVIPVIGGLVIFSEWQSDSIGTIIAKTIALVLITIGILLLSYASAKESEKTEKLEKSVEVKYTEE